MSYPPPPPSAAPAPAGKPRLRGRIPLRLALIFGILGLAGLIVGGVVGFKAGLSKVDDFQRVSLADGTGTLTFKAGDYLAYYEAPDYDTDGKSVPVVDVAMENKATGDTVDGELYGGRTDNKVKSLTYDYNGHHGAALYEFTIKSAGQYVVQVDKGQSSASSNADVAFGKSIATGLAVGGILAIVGVVLIIAAIVLLIVGLVKRSRHKKELATAGSYGYPPPPGYGAPQGYVPPQQGYAPPPQQGYAPPQQGYGQPQQGYQPPQEGWQQPPPPSNG